MKISTRGKYALRVMTDLAETGGNDFTPLKDVATRQNISQKYLESITTDLVKAGLLIGVHGKGGGYKLVKSPDTCSVGEILRATEGDLSPSACLGENAVRCDRSGECKAFLVWKGLYDVINDYLDGVSLSELIDSH